MGAGAGGTTNAATEATQANTSQSNGGGNGADDTASQVAAQLAEILRGNPNALKDILAQAGQSTGQAASQAAGQVQEQATSRLDHGKATLVEGLGSVVEQIRVMGENLRNTEQGGVVHYAAQYGDTAANQLERLSSYLNEHEVGELVGEVEDFARRNASYFVGGAFLLGLLGARFLKSSSPHQQLMRRLPPEGIAGSETHTVYSRSEGQTEGMATTSDGATHPLATPDGVLP
ncbi:MAG TPA: hypothetical protein VM911_12870 [Pyrinomonadaceae bacterium]|nr:hypothetical protein [Pyrinomonadaceae bacterium]